MIASIKKHNVALALQMFALLIYVYIGIVLYDFPRNLDHYFLIVSYSLFLDQLFYYSETGKFKLLFSPIIAGSAVFMLLTSLSAYVYLITATIAILSKYIIRIDRRHVFNPANIGVLFAVVFFTEDIVLIPGQWGVDNKIILMAATLGLLACTFANRLVLAISYLSTFVLIALIKSHLYNEPVLFSLGPIMGMAGVIFQFHMVTDPRTTPSEYPYQIAFGASVAALDIFLRMQTVLFSPFISLAVISASFALFYKHKSPFAIQPNIAGQ